MARQIVVIPNLFTSFLAEPPSLNPHYHSVRAESEQWLVTSSECNYKMQKKIHSIDFSYFCAVLAPKANYERFRLICDWGNWIFPFDDLFDDGILRENAAQAAILIERVLSTMQDEQDRSATIPTSAESEQRLVDCHMDIWQRFKSGTDVAGLRERYVYAMQEYCDGALRQVEDCSMGQVRSPEDLLVVRRSSIGAQPLFALVEYGHQLDIPRSVFENETINQIKVLGVDLILIQNDIVSYHKEEEEDVKHNLVAACRNQGMSAQEAFDYLGEMLEARLTNFEELAASLPRWDNATAAAVDDYVEGVRNSVRANLYWSLRTDRYFGAATEEVKKTRRVDVMVNPKYLQSV